MNADDITGRNQKLGLSGRQSRDVGILSTSKLYSLQDRIFAFTPQVSEHDESLMFVFLVLKALRIKIAVLFIIL